jgi:hypothetical protein
VPEITLAAAAAGGRHRQMLSLVCHLLEAGLNDEAVFAQFRGMYEYDLPDLEIRQIIAWGRQRIGYGPAAATDKANKTTAARPAARPAASLTREQAGAAALEWLEGFECDEASLWDASQFRPEDGAGPDKDSLLLLQFLYRPHELVTINTCCLTGKDGKLHLAGPGETKSTAEWIRHINAHGTPTSTGGAWIRLNPVKSIYGGGTGGAHNDADVAVYRYLLLESDLLEPAIALSVFGKIQFPIAAIIDSAGRGPHTWLTLKSSISMQLGCFWACGKPAFYLAPARSLRLVAMQHEDSHNDLYRMSALVEHSGLDPGLVHENFWIETVRGKIGCGAVKIARDLVEFWKADILLINPLTAYHDGDISKNEDNIQFLYGELAALQDKTKIGIVAIHHEGKPPRNGGKKKDDVYHEIQYKMLGGSTLTNFFRAIITVVPVGNSHVYAFTIAKRFEASGWEFKSEHFKWHEDRAKRLWVPAPAVEAEAASKADCTKTLEDLRKLIPVVGTIPREQLKNAAANAGFRCREYDGLLAQALDESTPDEERIYKWMIYNPEGRALVRYGRYEQPAGETAAVVRDAKREEKRKRAD